VSYNVFNYDPLGTGAKGMIYIGPTILVSRRDEKTNDHPFDLDLVGGRAEPDET
jgi:hypothetical protein